MRLVVAGPVGEVGHELRDHPERPARIHAAMAGIADLELGSDVSYLEAPAAERADLERVHVPHYLDHLEQISASGGGAIDPDTALEPSSWATARHAAGAGLAAIEELRHHDDAVAFCAVRPPGHHASSERAMGFCLLNNVAVAAAKLAAEGERVLVLDWDVHHGNGTQEIFWEDDRVLYVSFHQWPLYPGTGRPDEVGGHRALGTTLNVPVPPGATGDVLRVALEDVAVPVIDGFAPDWVLVSCGFDAHRDDPLAQLSLSSADFALLARGLTEAAPRPGRTVVFLEGGYDLGAVRRSTAATLSALVGAGAPASGREPPTSGGPGMDAVHGASALRERTLQDARGSAPGTRTAPANPTAPAARAPDGPGVAAGGRAQGRR